MIKKLLSILFITVLLVAPAANAGFFSKAKAAAKAKIVQIQKANQARAAAARKKAEQVAEAARKAKEAREAAARKKAQQIAEAARKAKEVAEALAKKKAAQALALAAAVLQAQQEAEAAAAEAEALALAEVASQMAERAAAIEERKTAFRDRSNNAGSYQAPIRAYKGIPIDQATLEGDLNSLNTSSTGDFRLGTLMRVMYFDDRYTNQILAHTLNKNYWQTKGEAQYVFNSENHMILWMSAYHLVQQKMHERGEIWDANQNADDMRKRLVHFLDLKLQYGFYEFFSPTYYKFSLVPLLNLADFSTDPEIKDKAARAAKRMVKEFLLLTNDEGRIYPTAGRSYISNYANGSGTTNMAWLIAGKGDMPTGTDYAGGALATTTVDFSDLEWTNTVNTTLDQGHKEWANPLVHLGFDREIRTLFQMSSGGYFTQFTAGDTAHFVKHYDLLNSEENKELGLLELVPNFLFTPVAAIGGAFANSSSLTEAEINIYKNRGVVLSSVQDYFPGHRGWQQQPLAAVVGDIPVFFQSGDIPDNFDYYSDLGMNTHLPKVKQNENAALLVYNPAPLLKAPSLIDIELLDLFAWHPTVNLFWQGTKFDEQAEDGKWIMGRRGNDYVAVYRDDTAQRSDGHYYSNRNDGRQLWAIVVGNSDTHGGFDNFKATISEATLTESFNFVLLQGKNVYAAELKVDGKTISNSL